MDKARRADGDGAESLKSYELPCKMGAEKWFFNKDQLIDTPSVKLGYPPETEQLNLQWASYYIQKMGRKLNLPVLCINTANLYMQRFYMCHPMQLFNPHKVTTAALFLAAKVEEHPRKLEIVVDAKSYAYKLTERPNSKQIIFYEDLLITTLGFDLQVQHAHKFVLKVCNDTRFNLGKPLSHAAYIFATSVLHLSRFNLVYKPDRIAYLCIHMAQNFINFKIPLSKEGKPWYRYCDESLTEEILDNLMDEFMAILEKCPTECKAFTLIPVPPSNASILVNSPPIVSKIACESSKAFNADTQLFEAKQVLADEKSHDPEKHFRKIKSTPTKSSLQSSGLKAIRPPLDFDGPQRHTSKAACNIPNFDSMIRTGEVHQRAHHDPKPNPHAQKPSTAIQSGSSWRRNPHGDVQAFQEVLNLAGPSLAYSAKNQIGTSPAESYTKHPPLTKDVTLEQKGATEAPSDSWEHHKKMQKPVYTDITNPCYLTSKPPTKKLESTLARPSSAQGSATSHSYPQPPLGHQSSHKRPRSSFSFDEVNKESLPKESKLQSSAKDSNRPPISLKLQIPKPGCKNDDRNTVNIRSNQHRESSSQASATKGAQDIPKYKKFRPDSRK